MAQERTLILIKERSFVAGGSVAQFACSVDWNQSRECTTTLAIYDYFKNVISGDRHSFLTMPFSDCLMHRSIEFRLWKEDAKFLCGLLANPIINIRIEGREDNDDINSKTFVILEKSLTLLDMIAPESNKDLETQHSKVFPLPSEMAINVGSRLVCNVSLGWNETSKPIQLSTGSLMEKLHEEESTMDLIIVAANGAEIKCHKLIFGAQCPAFSRMISAETGMKEALSNRVEMKENSEHGIRKLVDYMYGAKLGIGEKVGDEDLELFELAHKYGLEELENSLLELFLSKDDKWFTTDAILELYLYVRNLDVFATLLQHTIAVMASMRPCIPSSEEFRKMHKVEFVALVDKIMDYYNYVDMQQLNPQGGRGVKRPHSSLKDGPQN